MYKIHAEFNIDEFEDEIKAKMVELREERRKEIILKEAIRRIEKEDSEKLRQRKEFIVDKMVDTARDNLRDNFHNIIKYKDEEYYITSEGFIFKKTEKGGVVDIGWFPPKLIISNGRRINYDSAINAIHCMQSKYSCPVTVEGCWQKK